MADPSRYRQVLAHPVAGRIAGADLVSVVGDFLGLGALLLLAYQASGTVLGPAGLFAVQALPGLVLGVGGSGWLAQLNRRRWLPLLPLVGAAALVAAVAAPTLPVVLATAAVLGAVRTATTALRGGVIADDVPDGLRGALLALAATNFQVAQVVGFLAGASLAAAVGAHVALLADAATFVVAAAVLARLPVGRHDPAPARPGPLDGVRLIAAHPLGQLLAPAIATTLAVGAVPETLASGLVDGAWVGPLMAAHPAGVAAATWWLGRDGQLERIPVQLTLAAGAAAGLGVFAVAVLAGLGPLATIAAAVLFGLSGAWLAGAQATFATVFSGRQMAQVTATMIAALIVLEGVGALAYGTVADRAGPAAALATAAGLAAAAAAWGWVRWARLPAGLVDADGTAVGPGG